MNEFKLFDLYRRDNAQVNSPKAEFCDVNYLLRLWKQNKAEYLAPLFGDQLILEKKITYSKPTDELSNEMERVLRGSWDFFEKVLNQLTEVMGVNGVWDDREEDCVYVWNALRSQFFNAYRWVENSLYLGSRGRYYHDSEEIKSYTLNFKSGHRVQLQAGMKTTRAMTQICKELNLSDEWEKIRIQHSQVLNVKMLTGTLCLSIHPMDYATASDNDNGWSSCMSWQDQGCYRMGTVEMMNSPMVICAYLKSDKQHMDLYGGEWNSKKWRAWIIVTKDAIICNRHYPYHQAEMATSCINWVRDLVGQHYGWTYGDVHENFYQWMQEVGHDIEYHTNYMYNDLGGDDVIGCVRADAKKLVKSINFSGPAECMVCGEIIPVDTIDAGHLECENCFEEAHCCDCGDCLSEDDIYHGPDGRIYCERCYHDRFTECHECGEEVDSETITYLTMPIYTDHIHEAIKKLESLDTREANQFIRHMEWCDPESNRRYRRQNIVDMDSIPLCEDCADKYHATEICPNEHCMIVVNPHKVSMETVYTDLFNPAMLHPAMRIINAPDAYNDEEMETALIIKDFWTQNWNHFVADFDADQERE